MMDATDAPVLRNRNRRASFGLSNRLNRAVWGITWLLLAAWTPPALSPWRVFLLKVFGAKMASGSAVAASSKVWLPRHLQMGEHSTLGPGVDCYNMAPIKIGARSVISQRAFLCGGTHDISDRRFQLIARSITIGDDVWIASEAFVGPGVQVADGCVLGARGCAFSDLESWTVYRGNPAVPFKKRQWRASS
jgi:putative colanic acid biosynthesis acetyltransferase WcaF